MVSRKRELFEMLVSRALAWRQSEVTALKNGRASIRTFLYHEVCTFFAGADIDIVQAFEADLGTVDGTNTL